MIGCFDDLVMIECVKRALRVKKTLLLHAGTHKTASTYIQSRLQVNKNLLLRSGVRLLDIKGKVGSEKILPAIIRTRDTESLKSWLGAKSEQCQTLLYSAEQCTQPLLRKKRLRWFLDALEGMGIELKVSFFLRDQPDYINSMYIQKVKKFYHSIGISEYIEQCMYQQPDWFDYNYMFSRLIASPRVDVRFLPYGRQFGDPFERLMALPGWLPRSPGEWLPDVGGRANDQPGLKGVYLALRVSAELERLGVDFGKLKRRSRYIRRYLTALGWPSDRYFGLERQQVEKIREFYDSSNNLFVEKVWKDCSSWRSIFRDQRDQPLNVLDESMLSTVDKRELESLVGVVVEDLRVSSPDAFR